ncbi:AraC family ligand binding domain-containing protein, partial [Streptococcus suis]
DPDDVPRPVVTYGFITDAFGSIELAPHRHAKGQIILAQRGALSCEVDGGLWIVPPRSAIWIPGNALHSVKATGALEGYNAFIAPD